MANFVPRKFDFSLPTYVLLDREKSSKTSEMANSVLVARRLLRAASKSLSFSPFRAEDSIAVSCVVHND
uniref:Uncharacterized protein n=1 Tax=Arundo donax TaxID=35708 RepID=A0A0A9GRM8_ARUDO